MHILTIQNRREEGMLRKKTADVDFKKISREEIRGLIQTMRETMRIASGVGLSANQIGINLNMFVAQVGSTFYAIFNPRIIKESAETQELEEGCLSVPGRYGITERRTRVTLAGFDERGRPVKIKAHKLLAQVFQHEVDHLRGRIFIDACKKIYTFTEPKGTSEEAPQKK